VIINHSINKNFFDIILDFFIIILGFLINFYLFFVFIPAIKSFILLIFGFRFIHFLDQFREIINHSIF